VRFAKLISLARNVKGTGLPEILADGKDRRAAWANFTFGAEGNSKNVYGLSIESGIRGAVPQLNDAMMMMI
jgi:hypothetical protein